MNLKHRRINEYNDMLCIDLDNDSETHLFRHASEITRETKGGYLKGKISIPMTDKPCYLRLSLVPAERDGFNDKDLHPNMLHINLRQNKKTRQIQAGELPDDVDWAFVFRVDPNGTVSRVYSTIPDKRFVELTEGSPSNIGMTKGISPISQVSDHLHPINALNNASNYKPDTCLGPLKLPSFSCLALNQVTTVKDRKYVDLGTTGLMFNIITPLQKFSKGGITLTDVLKQRYQDLQLSPMPSDLAKQIEEYYTNKKDKIRLQRVRLMVEIFGCDLDFQKSATSQIITNSKSKECGPLSLHDVNPVVSCVQSRTKIMMLSFFKLVSEVKAAFILWSKEENCTINDHSILSRLKQPEDCTVFNQTVITCIAPPQSWDVIQEIRQKNLELRIFAYRPSDNRLSRNSFKFEYLEHVQAAQQTKHSFYGPTGPQCGFCYMQQYNRNTVELSLAKPGVQRRKHDNEGRNEVPDDLINELQNKSPPRTATETATSTITTRTEILQTRSPEREFAGSGSSSSMSRISSPCPEPIKLEPITVTSMEPCVMGGSTKPLFEIVMSPQDVIDLSTKSSPPRGSPGPSGGPFLVKRRISTSSTSATETCDQDLKRQKLLHSNY